MYIPEGYTAETLAALFRETDSPAVQITIGTTVLQNEDVVSIDIQEMLTDGGAFGIGTFPAKQLSFTAISGSLPLVLTGIAISVKFLAGDVGIPMGVFYADPSNVVTTEGVTASIVAYDAAYYLLGTYVPKVTTWPAKASTVLEDILKQQGTLQLASNWAADLDNTLVNTAYIQKLATVVPDEDGEDTEVQYASFRDAIAQVAFCLGANALMDREGKLTFRRLTPSPADRAAGLILTASDYPSLGFTRGANEAVRFDKLEASYIHDVTTESPDEDGETVSTTVSVADTFTYTASSASSNTLSIQSNDLRTQALTDTFGKALLGTAGLSYQPYTVTCIDGFPFLDLTDSIKLTDYQGKEWVGLPILSAEHTFGGAFTSNFGAAALADDDASLGASVSLQSQLATVSAKVNQNGRSMIDFISATNAQFDTVKANKADVTSLTAATGRIDKLESSTADIDTIRANSAKVKDVTASQITAATGYIGDLKTAGVTAESLSADHATIGSLSTTYVKADRSNIDEAWVKELMIQGKMVAQSGTVYQLTGLHIDAGDITAGTLAVDRLAVKGDDGEYYVLTPKSDGSGYDQTKINGSIIEKNSINADRITANSITTEQLTTNNVGSTNGWINFAAGTFRFTNDAGAGISWDGEKLIINAESIQMGGAGVATETDVDNLKSLTKGSIVFDTSYTFSTTDGTETANFEAHVYRYGEDVTSEFADSCFSWWRKLEGERTSGDMIRFATGKTCTVSLADCGYGASIVGQFETSNDASLLTTSSAQLKTLDETPLTALASGDSVRVSDLPTATPQFDDWPMGWSAASTYKATMRSVAEASMQVATKSEIEEALA